VPGLGPRRPPGLSLSLALRGRVGEAEPRPRIARRSPLSGRQDPDRVPGSHGRMPYRSASALGSVTWSLVVTLDMA